MKESTKPKEQFKDRLIEWSQTNLGIKFSNLNAFQQSRQMIKFFVSEILEKLNPGIVPDDEGELEDSIIDGSGDGGADLLYRSDDGHVLLIQAKYRGNNSAESAEAVGRFCDLQERLLMAVQGKQKSLHADLVELASLIDWDEDTFHLYFITTGKVGKSVQDRVGQGLSPVAQYDDLLDRSEFSFLEVSGLNQELREAISSADFSDRDIIIPMLPDAEGSPWCHYDGERREMYVGEVSGAVLANVLQTHKASLFTMNIRDYVGDSKTNKQIVKTALDDPTDFEYFNNGVTAVAGSIDPDPKKNTLTCRKMSIINGAQTVRSLLAATRKIGSAQYKPISNVRVLMRLMSFKYPAEISFVSDVTKYNNTQNAVKIADFRSNDPVQRDMARRFGNLNLSGKSYEYKNKRSSGKKRNSIVITLEELTKTVFAFRFGPDDMAGGTSKMFDATTDGLYTKVFEHPESALSEQDFNLIAGTFFACTYAKGLWEAERKKLRAEKKSMHRSLERKGLLYFTLGELERQSYAKNSWDLNHDLIKLAKPNAWLVNPKGISCESLRRAYEVASMVLVQQYDFKLTNDPGFKHRNWFREPQTKLDIEKAIALALAFGTQPRLWG